MGKITARLLKEAGTSQSNDSIFEDTKKLADYAKMEEDPQVSAILLAITLPILSADWVVIPSPSGDDTEAAKREEERAQYLQKGLFSVEGGFQNMLASCLSALTNGYAVLEKVGVLANRLLQLKALNMRPVDTLTNPKYTSTGQLQSVEQMVDGKSVTLPREKLLIVTMNAKHANDWRGRSLLFSARKPWLLKDMMERITTISHERWSMGIFKSSAPPGMPIDSPDWQKGEEMLQALEDAERSWVQMPDGWTLEALERKVGTETPLDFIRYLADGVAICVLALHLSGQSARSNSGAASSTLTEMFLHSVQAYGEVIADAITRDAMMPLYVANWGEPEGDGPRVKVRNIHGSSLERIGYLVQSGAIRVTTDLERFLYSIIGADYSPENVIASGPVIRTVRPNNTPDGPDPSTDGEDG